MAKKEENILEKILEGIKRLVNVSEKHKEISEKTYNKSISKREQRIWYIITIIIMIIIGTGIIINLSNDKESDPLKIDVIVPNKIILNEKGDIDFEIKFTNVGDKNLKNFDVLKMDLYRMEAGNLTYKRQVIYDNKDYSISCTERTYRIYQHDLSVGESCTIKTDMIACTECFDDKDKEVYLLIYFDSVPPIQNRMVNIQIY